jgi:hypothetical protein
MLSCILCGLCFTAGIYTVEHPEDGHRSDGNMYVQRIKGKIYTAEQLHKCAFVGLCMNV